ncbi:MAG: phosphate/phosphite/phosphonate ABC transporter substrate-binding protein [Acidiferrobacterales bacterium]
MSNYRTYPVGLALAGLALAGTSQAILAATALASNNAQGDRDVIVFAAPPRENAQTGEDKYAPIAEYLSKVLNKKVVYKQPGTWGVYRTEMLKGEYDIVFDGPHFNSYRAQKLKHNILVKIPIRHEFVVIVKKGRKRYSDIDQLAGRTFCTHAPPNLGTLTLLSQFPNPSRQPSIINTKGWKNIYNGVISGKCTAGILPIANLKKFDAAGTQANIVWKNRALPNQAFSAGPRLNKEEQQKIATALLSAQASGPTSKLRAAYRVGEKFERATNQEYAGVSEYLRNEWGYY